MLQAFVTVDRCNSQGGGNVEFRGRMESSRPAKADCDDEDEPGERGAEDFTGNFRTFPYRQEKMGLGISAKSLISLEKIGRRDWTRTNDPHHVKVVL